MYIVYFILSFQMLFAVCNVFPYSTISYVVKESAVFDRDILIISEHELEAPQDYSINEIDGRQGGFQILIDSQ